MVIALLQRALLLISRCKRRDSNKKAKKHYKSSQETNKHRKVKDTQTGIVIVTRPNTKTESIKGFRTSGQATLAIAAASVVGGN